MQRMTKILSLLLALALLTGGAALAEITLPRDTRTIEAQAFMNDASITGLVALDEGVQTLGAEAFRGSGIYALDLPASVQSIGADLLRDAPANYVIVRSRSAQIAPGAFDGVNLIIGQRGSTAEAYARASGQDFAVLASLRLRDGFYYGISGDRATLLCAKDARQIPAELLVPEELESNALTAYVDRLSPYAFVGCGALKLLGFTDSEITIPTGALAPLTNTKILYDVKQLHLGEVYFRDEVGLACEVGGVTSWELVQTTDYICLNWSADNATSYAYRALKLDHCPTGAAGEDADGSVIDAEARTTELALYISADTLRAGDYIKLYVQAFDDEGNASAEVWTGVSVVASSDYRWQIVTRNQTRGVRILGYNRDDDRDPLIPSSIGGLPVLEIASNAFYDCDCSVLNIPDGVVSIEEFAFYGFEHLTRVVLPASVTNFETRAFDSCYKLTEFVVSGDNPAYKSLNGVLMSRDGETLVCYPGGKADKTYTVPNGVKRIAAYACGDNQQIEKIVMPDSVTDIGKYAFWDCHALAELELSDGLVDIGMSAFNCCDALTRITIPGSVKSIGETAFMDCGALTRVELSEGVQSIGWGAFCACYSLTELSLPSSLSFICDYAFEACEKLAEITIPEGVWNLSPALFVGCEKLTRVNVSQANPAYQSIDGVVYTRDGRELTLYPRARTAARYTVPNGVKRIEKNAFADCAQLTEVSLPAGLIEIGMGAFGDCEKLSKIDLPDSVRSIGDDAFSSCEALGEIAIPAGVTSIKQDTFYGCSSLAKVRILGDVTSIEDYAFQNCTQLSEIALPASLTSIGEFAFHSCEGLSKVTIPARVLAIGYCAFGGCRQLSEITIPASVVQIEGDVFAACNALEKLYCVRGSAADLYDAYPDGITKIYI